MDYPKANAWLTLPMLKRAGSLTQTANHGMSYLLIIRPIGWFIPPQTGEGHHMLGPGNTPMSPRQDCASHLVKELSAELHLEDTYTSTRSLLKHTSNAVLTILVRRLKHGGSDCKVVKIDLQFTASEYEIGNQHYILPIVYLSTNLIGRRYLLIPRRLWKVTLGPFQLPAFVPFKVKLPLALNFRFLSELLFSLVCSVYTS